MAPAQSEAHLEKIQSLHEAFGTEKHVFLSFLHHFTHPPLCHLCLSRPSDTKFCSLLHVISPNDPLLMLDNLPQTGIASLKP